MHTFIFLNDPPKMMMHVKFYFLVYEMENPTQATSEDHTDSTDQPHKTHGARQITGPPGFCIIRLGWVAQGVAGCCY